MKLFLIIVIAICIMAIYDARRIAEKFFSSADKNKVVKLIKIFSFILFAICGITFCCLKNGLQVAKKT